MNSNIKYLIESFLDDEDEIKDTHIDIYKSLYVNLGLPSGTLWASCNLGATSPEEYGLFYQWGDISGHKPGEFDFNVNDYNKRFNDSEYVFNGTCQLKEKNDAAYIESEGIARIPTSKQINELIKNCKMNWTTLNGVIGVEFIGINGNSIFFPASGNCDGMTLYDETKCVNIWSQSCNSFIPKSGIQEEAYFMICYYYYADVSTTYRYVGFPIRAVINK